jgi:hypothetical protein
MLFKKTENRYSLRRWWISESLPLDDKTVFKCQMLIKCLFETKLHQEPAALKHALHQLSNLIDQYLGWFFTNGNKSGMLADDPYWD